MSSETQDIKPDYDVVVVGAGPAGMRAAITLSHYDIRVAVFDEQAQAGGQIYRNVESANALIGDVLSNESLSRQTALHGNELVQRFSACGADYFPESLVWFVERGFTLAVNRQGQTHRVRCRFLLVATGAMERPVPFSGWQLPGVMGAGAAQILLKTAGVVPDKPPVLFGTGPLLYLFAAQLIATDSEPAAILDTADPGYAIRSLAYLYKALASPAYLKSGAALVRKIRKSGVPHHKHVTGAVVRGNNKAEVIEFTTAGKTSSIETGLVLTHHGVIPETRLMHSAGAELYWDEGGQCWRPVCSDWGESSVAGLYSAGDVAGINGAHSAESDACLACFDILYQTGVLTAAERDRQAKPFLRKSRRDKSVRSFLESRYRVSEHLLQPSPDTIVCRCESVTAREITQAVDHGCRGPNQVKSFTRCGMGACQGRMCGPTVEAMVAKRTGQPRAETGCYRARAPVRPVSLAAFASLHDD